MRFTQSIHFLSTKEFTLLNHSSNQNQSKQHAPSGELLSESVNPGKQERYLRLKFNPQLTLRYDKFARMLNQSNQSLG